MQKFTYHTHNNNLGIFDGHNSAEEMIAKAEEMGFETIGVSNHLIWHPNVNSNMEKMFISDLNKAIDIHKRNIETIREAGLNHKIRVLVGAETDFFPSALWRNGYERLIKELNFDYQIATSHFVMTENEEFLCNLYHLRHLPADFPADVMHDAVIGHWRNISASVVSGYFNFLAHPDYCIIKIPDCPEYDEYRWQIIETLDKYKFPFEVNTSGYNRIKEQHPVTWMLKELCRRKVPTLLSDDAHCTDQIGQHFGQAELLLRDLNCQARFSMENLKYRFKERCLSV